MRRKQHLLHIRLLGESILPLPLLGSWLRFDILNKAEPIRFDSIRFNSILTMLSTLNITIKTIQPIGRTTFTHIAQYRNYIHNPPIRMMSTASSSSSASAAIVMDPFCLKQFSSSVGGQHIPIPCQPNEFVQITNQFYDKETKVTTREREREACNSIEAKEKAGNEYQTANTNRHDESQHTSARVCLSVCLSVV